MDLEYVGSRKERDMSQRNVEGFIGRLVTDEALRRRFEKKGLQVLFEMISSGLELTTLELRALAAMDSRLVACLADALDPRIQKTDGEEVAH
jgi:hypothetical protein